MHGLEVAAGPMQLTVVTRGLGRGSGTAGYAARLVGQLRARGHDVAVVVPGQPTQGVVIALERVPDAHLWRPGGGWHADAARATGRLSWSRQVWLDWQAARTAKVVLANSRMVADALFTRGIRAEVLRTGVDLARFAPREPEPAVLFVGHGWRRKNLEGAVRALVRSGANHVLWVAGRDSRRAWRLARARAVLGAHRVVDLGPSIDVAEWVGRAAAVLHPTLYDPASNLVLEAMAAGVPVVSTTADGSSELLPVELVADSRDVEALARCLGAALCGGRVLGSALRRRVESWPDSRNADEVERRLARFSDG